MGYASHLIWKAGNETFEGEYGNALMFYAGSLALNLSFTPVFFGSKNLTAVSNVLSIFLSKYLVTGCPILKWLKVSWL